MLDLMSMLLDGLVCLFVSVTATYLLLLCVGWVPVPVSVLVGTVLSRYPAC